MVSTVSRSLEDPSRKFNVTVPEVVGFHVNVVGLPAVSAKPSGILKGFSFFWARVMAKKAVKGARAVRCMIKILQYNAGSTICL